MITFAAFLCGVVVGVVGGIALKDWADEDDSRRTLEELGARADQAEAAEAVLRAYETPKGSTH